MFTQTHPEPVAVSAFRAAPLRDILKLAERNRWRGLRSEGTMIGGARVVVATLEELGVETFDDVTTEQMQKLKDALEARGNRPGTVALRFLILRQLHKMALQNVPPLCSKALPEFKCSASRPQKWWLKPGDQTRLFTWLPTSGLRQWQMMQDYIEFVINTGLRVEEALRVTAASFVGLHTDRPSLHVPGTKTALANSTIPIRREAAEVARRRLGDNPTERLFDIGYEELRDMWVICRAYLGYSGVRTCTLRALRRSFGKIATERGMPTEVLQKLYRHEDIKTTIGYLNLVGSIDTDETRRWLE